MGSQIVVDGLPEHVVNGLRADFQWGPKGFLIYFLSIANGFPTGSMDSHSVPDGLPNIPLKEPQHIFNAVLMNSELII